MTKHDSIAHRTNQLKIGLGTVLYALRSRLDAKKSPSAIRYIAIFRYPPSVRSSHACTKQLATFQFEIWRPQIADSQREEENPNKIASRDVCILKIEK